LTHNANNGILHLNSVHGIREILKIADAINAWWQVRRS